MVGRRPVLVDSAAALPMPPAARHEAARSTILRLIRASTTMSEHERDTLRASLACMWEAFAEAEGLIQPAGRPIRPFLSASIRLGAGR